MKDSQRNSRHGLAGKRGFASWWLLAGIAALLILVMVVALLSRSSVVVPKRQAALIEGIERRSPARIARLVSPEYEDPWGFTREDAVEALVDVGSQFMTLVLTPEDETVRIEGRRARVETRLRVGGNPVGPIGNEVTRRLNRLEGPFVFTWEKTGVFPGAWRLVRIEHPEIPLDLHGYTPGDIRRAMRGEAELE